MTDIRRCGFVAVLGATNAGKSTPVNQLVGSKVSITSRKVQTTRRRILGIQIQDNTQIVLVDTPGLFRPKTSLDKTMVKAAWSAVRDTDVVLFLWDARLDYTKAEPILKKLQDVQKPVYLVLNKIDLVPRDTLLTLSANFNALREFSKTFMISALHNQGLSELLKALGDELPEGPWHYPEDQLSDLPLRLLAAEITREHLFDRLHQEIPYALVVETQTWEPFEDGSVRIGQVVHVQKPAQKAIVLGKGGQQLKAIGQAARKELTAMLGHTVHLVLHVLVTPRWMEDRSSFGVYGLEDPKELS